MNKTSIKISLILATLLLFCVAIAAADEPPLTNSDVIKLTKLSMGDQVIITKIKTAKNVNFNTSTDDLAYLKNEGVSSPVITAILERNASGAATASNHKPGRNIVSLITKEGAFEIKPISGEFMNAMVPFYGLKRFAKFRVTTSAVHTKDRRPSLVLNANAEPYGALWMVKLDSWDKGLVVDLPPMQGWGGTVSNIPEESYIIPYNATEEEPGLWRITPKAELKPGEYGLFRWATYNATLPLLVGFRVD